MAKKVFEEIKAWDGTSGTGEQARNVVKENFDKVNEIVDEIDSSFDDNLRNSIKAWALSESFALSSPTFDNEGYVSGGVITWPDADVGSISNVTIGVHGITSIRYNRSEAGKYATVNIAYDGSGIVSNQEVVLTGF